MLKFIYTEGYKSREIFEKSTILKLVKIYKCRFQYLNATTQNQFYTNTKISLNK